jgi:hypothetical protein
VFQIFDEDGDGRLSHREFIAIMKDRLHRGFKVSIYLLPFHLIFFAHAVKVKLLFFMNTLKRIITLLGDSLLNRFSWKNEAIYCAHFSSI